MGSEMCIRDSIQSYIESNLEKVIFLWPNRLFAGIVRFRVVMTIQSFISKVEKPAFSLPRYLDLAAWHGKFLSSIARVSSQIP